MHERYNVLCFGHYVRPTSVFYLPSVAAPLSNLLQHRMSGDLVQPYLVKKPLDLRLAKKLISIFRVFHFAQGPQCRRGIQSRASKNVLLPLFDLYVLPLHFYPSVGSSFFGNHIGAIIVQLYTTSDGNIIFDSRKLSQCSSRAYCPVLLSILTLFCDF